MHSNSLERTPFTSYQLLLVSIFILLLFTIVVDYMTMPALSAILLPELQITTKQFGLLVSAYAFSAGISSFLAMGFVDRFDRKKLLLFYYGGFLLGMLLCANTASLSTLIIARIITGAFGGVVASICFAIIADLFKVNQRGRVMGYVQMAFAASQVVGLPVALYLANNFNWHLTYWLFFALGFAVLLVVAFKIKPIIAHLHLEKEEDLLYHSLSIVRNRSYWAVFLNNAFLVLADVMFMTFSAAYCTNNLGVSLDDLPLLFGIAGVATLVFGPLIGQFTDRYGKFNVFVLGSILAMTMVATYSHLGDNMPFWVIALLHTLLFIGINARMIASTAITTVVPAQTKRGAFMALDATLQQMTGGLAAGVAGLIVVQRSDGIIQGYSPLSFVVIAVMFVTVVLMYLINRMVEKRQEIVSNER